MDEKTIPVVIIAFNRPDYLSAQLRAMDGYPFILYLDGPRNNEDVIKQREIAKIVKDNSNLVEMFHSEKNLGCKQSVINAIINTFKQYESAIFLEDDCIPVKGFYEYSLQALSFFRNDDDVALISLSNLVNSGESVCVQKSRFINCWGWCGWAGKTEQLLNFYYTTNSLFMLNDSVGYSRLGFLEKLYWKQIFIHTFNSSSIWDFYLQFNMFRLDKVSVLPPVNLINNVGFGDDATHTKCKVPSYVLNNHAEDTDVRVFCFESCQVNNKRDVSVSRLLYGLTTFALVKLFLGNIKRIVSASF